MTKEEIKNQNTPAEILVKLASDKDDYVRWEAARNPKTPAGVLTSQN